MERIPTLVQEFKLAATTNSVCVAIVKFTLGQFALYFTAAAPAPVKLARQITSLRAAYDVMNDAYAEQQKRVETAGIKQRDDEGDQLLYGVKGMLEGAVRMTYDQVRYTKANLLWEAFRKYRIDPTENMISEWSKVQQFCEEYLGKADLQDAGALLSVDGPIRRLAVLADEIRDLMTERNAATPTQGAMANAREAVYPEYRTAILLLNAFVAISDDPTWMAALVKALNDNLNYVRKHSMTQGGGGSNNSNNNGGGGSNNDDNNGSGGSDDNNGGSGDNGGDTPGGDNNGGGSGDNGGGSGDNGGDTPGGGDNGGGSGDNNGGGSGDNNGGGGDPTDYN